MKFKGAAASKALTGEVARRLRVDFESGQGKYFKAGFNQQLELKARVQANLVAAVADTVIKEEYASTVEEVADVLVSGIPIELGLMQGWPRLLPSYARHKKRYGTGGVFWKYRGSLATYFRRFANSVAAKSGLLKSKPASYTAVRLISEGFKNHRRYYRYTYNVTLPEITASHFRDILFRQQFLRFEDYLPLKGAEEPAPVFRKIYYNEVQSYRAPRRAWVQQLVRVRGKYAQQRMLMRINEFLKS